MTNTIGTGIRLSLYFEHRYVVANRGSMHGSLPSEPHRSVHYHH